MSERSKAPAEVEQAIAAFLRGLIAADYSMRTIKASADGPRAVRRLSGRDGASSVSEPYPARTSVILRRLWPIREAEALSLLPRPLRRISTSAGGSARGPYARSTIARKLSVVRSFLGFCEDNGLLEASPGGGVGSPRGARGAFPRCSRPTRLPSCSRPWRATSRWNCAIGRYSS